MRQRLHYMFPKPSPPAPSPFSGEKVRGVLDLKPNTQHPSQSNFPPPFPLTSGPLCKLTATGTVFIPHPLGR